MFYVSNISGNLVPFEPGITPLSVTVPQVSSLPIISSVVATPITFSMPATTPTPHPVEAVGATLASTCLKDDAAIYEGHVVFPNLTPNTSAIAANIAGAGAIAAYQSTNMEGAGKSFKAETFERISSVSQTDSLDKNNHDTAYRVDPIQYRRPQKEKRIQAVIARDIMSSPVFTLEETTTAQEARRVFTERKFRHIPIVSKTGKLVGIVSDRDFLGFVGESEPTIIKDLMVTNILTTRPEAEIRTIAEVLITHHIGCLPIVDEMGSLVGMLTRGDILRAVVNHAPIELWT